MENTELRFLVGAKAGALSPDAAFALLLMSVTIGLALDRAIFALFPHTVGRAIFTQVQ